MKWQVIVALICISLINSEVEHLSMCLLATHIPSLEKCLPNPLACFWICCLFFLLLSFINSLHILSVFTFLFFLILFSLFLFFSPKFLFLQSLVSRAVFQQIAVRELLCYVQNPDPEAGRLQKCSLYISEHDLLTWYLISKYCLPFGGLSLLRCW